MPEVKVLRYSSSEDFEQCHAAMRWEGSAEPLRLMLVRAKKSFEYRMRDEATLTFFFGSAETLDGTPESPLLRIRAAKGFAGAILSSFPNTPNADLARVYRFCVDVCHAVAGGPNEQAAALARNLAIAGKHAHAGSSDDASTPSDAAGAASCEP